MSENLCCASVYRTLSLVCFTCLGWPNVRYSAALFSKGEHFPISVPRAAFSSLSGCLVQCSVSGEAMVFRNSSITEISRNRKRALFCVSSSEGKGALLALIECVSEWANKGSSLFAIWIETGGRRVGFFHPCLFSSSWLEWNTTSGAFSYNCLHQKSDQGGMKFPLGSSPFAFFDPVFFLCWKGFTYLLCCSVSWFHGGCWRQVRKFTDILWLALLRQDPDLCITLGDFTVLWPAHFLRERLPGTQLDWIAPSSLVVIPGCLSLLLWIPQCGQQRAAHLWAFMFQV